MRLKALIPLLLCVLLLTGCTGTSAPSGPQADATLTRYTGSFLDVFDTVTQVIVYDADETAAEAHVQEIHDTLLRYHRLYDIYNAYDGVNNLSTVNANAGVAPVAVDDEILDLIAYAKDMYRESGGKVNIAMGSVLSIWHTYREAGISDPENAALPPMEELQRAALHTDIDDVVVDRDAGTVYLIDPEMRLDVGAIAKGYAGQQVLDKLRREGVTSLLLSIGGNVCGIGGRADGADWKVGIESPDGNGYLCTLGINDRCLVTSGTYQRYYTVDGRRYHHIIDPETLLPAAYFESVSVLCRDSGHADALSTALSIRPLAEGQALVESLDGVEAMWLDQNGVTTYSAGFPAFLVQR